MKRALIVDDSRVIRNFISYTLTGAGFAVATAVDGADGLEKFLREAFDVVLTDINMPGMDGYELVRRIRASRDHDHVPIIMITTERGDADRARGFALGVSVYLTKPADPERIVEHVRLLVGAA
jgi:two-component system chemotaxis response regulator CheY